MRETWSYPPPGENPTTILTVLLAKTASASNDGTGVAVGGAGVGVAGRGVGVGAPGTNVGVGVAVAAGGGVLVGLGFGVGVGSLPQAASSRLSSVTPIKATLSFLIVNFLIVTSLAPGAPGMAQSQTTSAWAE